MTNDNIKNLADCLVELSSVIEETNIVARDIVRHIINSDIEALDSALKLEQAMAMKITGLNNNKDKLISSLGYEGRDFNSIIEDCIEDSNITPENIMHLKGAYDNLKSAVNLYHSLSDEAQTLIEINKANYQVLIEERLQKEIKNNGSDSGAVKHTDIRI